LKLVALLNEIVQTRDVRAKIANVQRLRETAVGWMRFILAIEP
jgi:hypothetical protein